MQPSAVNAVAQRTNFQLGTCLIFRLSPARVARTGLFLPAEKWGSDPWRPMKSGYTILHPYCICRVLRLQVHKWPSELVSPLQPMQAFVRLQSTSEIVTNMQSLFPAIGVFLVVFGRFLGVGNHWDCGWPTCTRLKKCKRPLALR